jgi:hypothetical protein
MSGKKPVERDLAIKRGLGFIYRTACDPDNFALYGYDYLFCFRCIASTSKAVGLRRTALNLGRELARQWRQEHPKVLNDADADDIAGLIIGSYAADRLGVRDDVFKRQLREVAGRFTPRDYFYFDPSTEPPPKDVPEECRCGACNSRGRTTCRRCKRRLSMMSSYEVWLDALTRSFIGERYVDRLGASFADVIKWLPSMRPYPKYEDRENPDFDWAVYAITHVVYTLNNYSLYNLSPRWLPQEYAFLKRNLKRAIVMDDPEMMGELLDALKSFGLTETHPLIRKGLRYLLAQQNFDGSWGDPEAEDIYQRYHPTWTAIDGLREYAWRGERLSFQRLRPLLGA